jgi:hypothetical protein
MAAKGGQWKEGVFEPAKAAEVRSKLGTVKLALRDEPSKEVPALARHGDLVVHHGLGGGYSVTHAPTGIAAGHYGRRKIADAFAQTFGTGDGAATFSRAVAGDKVAQQAMSDAARKFKDADRDAVSRKTKGALEARRPRPEPPKRTLAELGTAARATIPKEAAPFLRSNPRVTGGHDFLGQQRFAEVKWKGETYTLTQQYGGKVLFWKPGARPVDNVPEALRRRAEGILDGVIARQNRWVDAESRMSKRARRAFKRHTGRETFELGGMGL